MRSLTSDSEMQVWLCMRKYLHGSWFNGNWPMTHVTHAKKWPIPPFDPLTHHPSTIAWCLLCGNVLHAARWIQDAKITPKIAIGTPSGHIFATKPRIEKPIKQQYFPHMPYNMVNFDPLAAEVVSLVWGTQANFNRFRAYSQPSRRLLDVYHTSTHGVAWVWI